MKNRGLVCALRGDSWREGNRASYGDSQIGDWIGSGVCGRSYGRCIRRRVMAVSD